MRTLSRRRGQDGFTLVELLVVIAISASSPASDVALTATRVVSSCILLMRIPGSTTPRLRSTQMLFQNDAALPRSAPTRHAALGLTLARL